jgi:hypothetical protein
MLTAPAKPAIQSGLSIGQLLDLLASPDEARRVLKEILTAEEQAATRRAEANVAQAQAVDAERQLADRKKAIDADWVRLKQAQSDLDDAKATLARREADLTKNAENFGSFMAAEKAKLAARERGLGARAAEQNKGWAELEAKTQTALVEQGESERALERREAAVAEREQRAADLAAMLAKVTG